MENYETSNTRNLLFVYKLEKLVNVHFSSGSKCVYANLFTHT